MKNNKISSASDCILVTGSSGFVGSNLVRRLVKEEKDVHIILKKESNPWRIKDLLEKVTVHYCDLVDAKGLADIIKRVQPSIIYHLATRGGYTFQSDVDNIFQIIIKNEKTKFFPG